MAASVLRSPGDTRVARLLAADVSAASPAPFGPDALERLARGLGLPPAGIPAVVEAALAAADRLLDQAARLGLGLVGLTDPQYPPWLRQIVDPPPVLWLKGRAPVLSRAAVAVVGSRDATPTGLAVARRLAGGLADAGLTVVSGLARGIDGAAHAGALDAGGPTVAVLGCGVDIAYPRSHEALAAETAASGAVTSELPPGTPPLPGHFPLRNRIISGLARAVVIVEASERSGSLITARLALEQGRDVLAVPGGVASGRHRGCHALIKDGARLVETVEDILDEIRWRPQAERRPGQPAHADNTFAMSDIEAIMAVGEPYGLDDLAARTGRPAAELLAELGRLEVAGRIGRFGPGCFVRLDGSAMDRG